MSDGHIPHQPLPRYEVPYVLLACVFVVMFILTNIIGVKLFYALPKTFPSGLFGEPFTLTSGIITYPITFLCTDIVSEVYGRRRADLMVFVGFFMSFVMLALVLLVMALPGSPVWVNPRFGFHSVAEMQNAFESVMTLPGTLIFGSMFAYMVAQLTDNRLFHFWRRVTRGRHLWVRNNGSTIVSQLVDTIIVNTIFLGFGLHLPAAVMAKIIVSNYLFKLVIALLDTPLCYAGVYLVKRYLGVAWRQEVHGTLAAETA